MSATPVNTRPHVPLLFGLLLALVPGAPTVRCFVLQVKNDRLETEIAMSRNEIHRLESAVTDANGMRTSEMVRAAEQLKELESRLDGNRKLSEETDEAESKLAAIEQLMSEHRRIAGELDDWKRMFPELFSGL